MALRVGDLYLDMEARNVDTVEQGLRRVRSAAEDVSRRGGQAGSDLERAMRDAARAAGRTQDQLRDVEVPAGARDSARRMSTEVEGIGDRARRAGEQLGNMGAGLGQRLSSAGSGAGGEFGGSFLSAAGPRIMELGGKGGPIAMAVAGVAAIGLGAGALLADAIGDGMKMEQTQDKIQAQLGTTPEMMKTIAKASADAYTNVFGESVEGNMEAAKNAIQAGLLNGEETADEMQPVIESLTTVSDLLGEDVPRVSRSAAQMIKNGMAKDAKGAMDVLVKATQMGLNVSEDLLDTVDEYSTKFRDLGLDGPTSMSLLSQAVKAGARDTDVAADALKEFQIRATDGSKAAAEGYAALGLNAEEMTAKIGKGGEGAKEGLNEVLTALQAMPPGFERTQAAVALFGTKAEDMGDALYKMNLKDATRDAQNFAGAFDQAATVMGDNAATKLEGARRSIETSMDGVKLALGQAFGPALGDLATWVSTHKPEIIAFFTQLADGAFGVLQGMLSFVSGTLRAFADLQEGIGDTVGKALVAMGKLTETVGGFLKHIPGFEDMGKAMEGVGKGAAWYGDQMDNAADKARGLADNVDKLNKGLDPLRDQVVGAGADAAASAELTRAFGEAVVAVPGEKTITINDNTPEAKAKLEALGLKVKELPDGQFEVYADTEEGQRTVDAFIRTNTGKQLELTMTADWSRVDAGIRDRGVRDAAPAYSPESGYVRYAEGTADHSREPGITNKAILWGEAGPEAYIPLGGSKRPRSMALLADVARRFGQKVTPMEDGGIVDSLISVQKQVAPELTVTDTLRPGAADYHGAGKAVDFSNGSGNTDAQLKWANYLADNHKDELAELIYIDPRFGRCIKDGEFVPDSFYAGAGDHTNHVHAAAMKALTDPKARGKQGNLSEKEKNALKIIEAGRKRGISDKGIRAALMAGLAESDIQDLPDAPGSEFDSSGAFQQRPSMGWGPAGEGVEKDANDFYDRLVKQDYENMDEAAAAQSVQRSAFADGSNYAAKRDEADDLLNRLGNSSSSSTLTGSESSSKGLSGSGPYDVNVLNWPSILQGSETSEDTRQARARLGLAFYAGGGTVPGVGNEDSQAAMLTPGEEVIRKGPAMRNRALLKWLNAGGSLEAFAGGGTVGGFGGYTTEGARYKRKMNLSDWMALGVGAGFMAASGFNNDGTFKGFSTGSTDIPGSQDMLNKLGEIASKPTIVIEHAEIKTDDPKKLVDDMLKLDPNTMAMTTKGLFP